MATKKKTPAKKVSAKRATPRKATSTARKQTGDESFKIVRERTPFLTFKVTEQTIYWSILFIYVFALSLWVLNIQMDILDIVNQIN